jgi:hypothetical protein
MAALVIDRYRSQRETINLNSRAHFFSGCAAHGAANFNSDQSAKQILGRRRQYRPRKRMGSGLEPVNETF